MTNILLRLFLLSFASFFILGTEKCYFAYTVHAIDLQRGNARIRVSEVQKPRTDFEQCLREENAVLKYL